MRPPRTGQQRRRGYLAAGLCAALLGCGDAGGQAQDNPPSSAAPRHQATEPQAQQQPAAARPPLDEAKPMPPAALETPERTSDGPAGRVGPSADDRPYAAHREAGRCPFPLPDEAFDGPIPARRLADEEQFAPGIKPEDIPETVPWDQAKHYVGYGVTVEGTIVSVNTLDDAGITFLNFHRAWRDKFYMVLFEDLAKTLDPPAEDLFTGKTIRVRGLVELHRGTPQIKILSMDQVAFIDP